jgi:pyridoxine 5-phosphate synthase
VNHLKLGLNIDHAATVREARGGDDPNLLALAREGVRGGADQITIHLREDRRHIQDRDVAQIKKKISVPLNLEMSAADEIVRIACRVKPEKACLVPERRQELTTEGGLDLRGGKRRIVKAVRTLQARNILVSLFIDPIPVQIWAAYDAGCDFVELHTGRYANTSGKARQRELKRLKEGAKLAHALGLGVNAGHGLNYQNVKPVARIPNLHELNIGHSIIARSLSVGLFSAVRQIRVLF